MSVSSNILFGLAAYNLSKLPWYLGLVGVPNYGLEASMPFHPLIGYRGSKLQSHPVLFLAPHVVMGSSLLTLFGLYLRGDVDVDTSSIFLPLSLIFAVHVIPERSGIPNRSKGLPLNEVCVAMILSAAPAALFFSNALLSKDTAMKICVVPCIGAAVMELLPVIACAVKKIKTKGGYVATSEDGDKPLKRNMSGYSRCPFAKAVDITTQGYPSESFKSN